MVKSLLWTSRLSLVFDSIHLQSWQDLVQRLSRLAVDVPALAELDLNPVLGLTSGAVVVDARVRLARPAPSVGAKGW